MDESTEVSSAGASTPQLTDFLQIFERQMQAAEAREQRLATMLQSAIQSAGPSAPASGQSPPRSATKQISADCPVLLSSATLADFTSWEEAWHDYAACQHLSSQNRASRVSAVRQAFDDDIRRYLQQGVISTPSNADVPAFITAVTYLPSEAAQPVP